MFAKHFDYMNLIKRLYQRIDLGMNKSEIDEYEVDNYIKTNK